MFRLLLNTTEKRHLHLMELLAARDAWTYELLSESTGYSVRTIKSDLKYFKEEYGDFVTIESSTTPHIRFQLRNTYALADITMKLYRENTNVQFLRMIFEHISLTKHRCTEELHISPSTLSRSIIQINTVLKEFNLEITGHPYRIKGAEHHIRYFFGLFYWSIYHKSTTNSEKELLEKCIQFTTKIRKKDLLDLSIVLSEKAGYFLMISLYAIRRGHFMEGFRSPLTIPRELRDYTEEFLSQFSFAIPDSDLHIVLFYFLSFYPKKEELFQTAEPSVFQIKETMAEYIDVLQKNTTIQLKNRESLVNQLTVQYIYKNIFQGLSFMTGPSTKKDYLGSLGPRYRAFIKEAKNLLEEEFNQKLGMTSEDKRAFLYWLISRWDGLPEQIFPREHHKVNVLIISELGRQQETFLKSLFKQRFGDDAHFVLHIDQHDVSAEIDCVLTDTFSELIEMSATNGTRIVGLDYNYFEESVQKLEMTIHALGQTKKRHLSDPHSHTEDGRGWSLLD